MERPVGRTPSLPGTVPRPSARLRSGVVNLPEVCRCAAASAGALMIVLAGRMAWPVSVPVNTVSSASAEPAISRAASEIVTNFMGLFLCLKGMNKPYWRRMTPG